MKNFIRLSCALLLASLSVASCKKDTRVLNENVVPVGTLNLPEDQLALTLRPASTDSLDFTWAATSAADGDFVLYELAFDKADGDFSNPVFKSLSNGGGLETRLSLSHKDLNKIANMAGIAASSSGKLKWTVLASKSTKIVQGSVSRILDISRPAGFAELPAEMYLSGSATEAGTDLSKALKLKKNEDGVFEIYTALKPGSYVLSDKAGEGGKSYFVDNGMIKEGDTPVSITEEKVYRLTLDFNVASSNIVEIQSLGLWMSAYNAEIGQLEYVGNSTWVGANIPVEFYQFDWGRDDRYKFVFHTSAGLQFMGSQKADNGSPVGQPASYFVMQGVSNDQWANTYKFNPAADRKNVRVQVLLSGAAGYTHQITLNSGI
jgi:hypothetical protein